MDNIYVKHLQHSKFSPFLMITHTHTYTGFLQGFQISLKTRTYFPQSDALLFVLQFRIFLCFVLFEKECKGKLHSWENAHTIQCSCCHLPALQHSCLITNQKIARYLKYTFISRNKNNAFVEQKKTENYKKRKSQNLYLCC